jgi:acryloyl-coenzyme A reductase
MGADDVLLRVRACGLCHTDLKVRDGLVAGCAPPLVLGHEVAGEVVAVGTAVRQVSVGQRGVPYGYEVCEVCGVCRACRSGRESLCAALGGRIGFGRQGGQSELVRVPARLFLAVDPQVTFAQAAVATCSIVTPYRALLRRARLRAGESLVVVGAGGGLGLHAVQLGRLVGAEVVAVDADEERRKAIFEQGADHFVASSGPFAERIRIAVGRSGADVALDLVGSAASLSASLRVLRPGGRLVAVGYRPDQVLQASIPELVFGEVEVYGCHWASILDLAEVLALIGRGAVHPVITRSYPLEAAPDALAELEAGRILGRAVLTL